MRLNLLRPLYERPGPWASVYLDTSQDAGDASRAAESRWSAARDALADAGCDPLTVHALDDAVMDHHPEVPGRHGLALFATAGEVIMRQVLPDPPAAITAYDPLPHAMPMVVQLARDAEDVASPDQFRDGMSKVVIDLSRGEVETLLLIDDPSSTEQLWIGPDPMQLSDDPETLNRAGIRYPPLVRADAAMLRALTVADGSIRLVDPADQDHLPGGIGALPR
ncbi:hypothetical protein GCM10010168_42880 [Actinoplanes ianthinogenes]|uniref:SseB protein N-terminal domain-containing protein n=1 Tax=Actinoplanes ianthinogenes TaxID=122358 RepID=A0ABM7LVP3_9ACTN|nr:hypothetical protein [Actinoplanes ianthinogenes]BCJ43402.1 hypothetical protein Aiant_40590 [Actinoplanes ianthinogenes]GGR20352.1 hypothetical protein GCM10010168_42880 [Actinoplanes ianthinogenes]